ncbi:hypothetical protein AKJ47_01515 [candidate division MSBL1 archaeon SCGC-AAA261G05]|uniref:Uncharacterized protein n=2 Tax=candidate division MSBL1 TaxID=215777 RepID=A0A133V216_9EURY|nr:hypothetical protein AKJ42_00540 [candidate division MSBL1 archaeon SCGC-AAA261C02]KXB03860.1 hypothetical protein AKJ47_01515 [candidate division MSBL1 archaeon SCGC-AAA261G05]
METITIIINSPAYGTEKAWNALRLAGGLVVKDVDVRIFLLGNGVSLAKKNQETPKGFYNLEEMLGDLIEKGVEVKACGTCIKARGLNQEEVIDGIEVGSTMLHLVKWVKESQKVLTF